jgi:hypothetical protein
MVLICKLSHSGELCERENWHVVELDDGTFCCTLCTGLLETSMLFAHSSGTKAPVACDPASGAMCVTTLVVKGHSHSATGWRATIGPQHSTKGECTTSARIGSRVVCNLH